MNRATVADLFMRIFCVIHFVHIAQTVLSREGLSMPTHLYFFREKLFPSVIRLICRLAARSA